MTPATPCPRVVTREQIKGLRWFHSLARSLEAFRPTEAVHPELRHSLQFYGLYAQTGDRRYLTMCEDFLKSALAAS